MSRTKRSAQGLATSFTYTGITVMVGFFSTPLLLAWLGPVRFGAFKALSEWLAYLPLLELGLSGAMAGCLAPAVGKGDNESVRDILRAGFWAYCRLTPMMWAVGVALAWMLPGFPGFRVLNPTELRSAALILMVAGMWNPLTVFRVLAESRQRLYIVNSLLALQTLLTTTLLLLTARAGWGLPGQSLAIILPQIPTAGTLAWLGLRTYPGVLRRGKSGQAGKQIWKLNWPTFVNTVSARLGLLSDNIVIVLFLGPAAVGAFFLTQRLPYLVSQQLQAIGSASWAGLVELHAQGKREIFQQRLLDLTGLTSGLAIAILGPVAVFNYHFVAQWVGAANYAGPAITCLAVVNMWLGSIFSLWGWPITGSGHIALWVPFALMFTAINVAVSVGATAIFGMPGPLIGTTVAFLLVQTWALPRLLERLFQVGVWPLWKSVLEHLRWGIPYCFLLLAATPAAPRGWLQLLPRMALAVAGGIACWWLFGLSGSARIKWRGWARATAGI